ncbi:MAG: DUF1302 domain-containing protein [Panacagrimonas sp.]
MSRFIGKKAGGIARLLGIRGAGKSIVTGLVGLLAAGLAEAGDYKWEIGGQTVEINSNTTLIAGAAIRTESRDQRLIAKGHLDPNVCGRTAEGRLWYQSCQGLFKDQVFPAQKLAAARGYGSSNFDQGNLNYDGGDLTQAPLKFGQDFNFTWGDFGLFVKGFYFYDLVNEDFTQTHPNRITSANVDQVGFVSRPGDEIIRLGNIPGSLSVLGPIVSQLNLPPNILTQLLGNPLGIPTLGVRNDSRPCPADRNPSGGPCGIVYGPGGRQRFKRTDHETLREVGQAFHLLDLNFYGTVDVPGLERELTFKIGRQSINQGESTVQFFDSLNYVNPANTNNLFRVGGNGLDDFYLPVNAVSLTMQVVPSVIASVNYLLEWDPIVAPAPGSYYSFINAGTNNAGPDHATLAFGQLADDPEQIARLLDNPLTGITNTDGSLDRLSDREPNPDGQIGIEIKWYNEGLNNGTEFGFYFANYHSRSPIVSVNSTSRSCMKDARNTAAFVLACPDLPLFNGIYTPNQPDRATSDAVDLDGIDVFLEYPENVNLYGLTFTTSAGDFSFQGEVAYRPKDPLQVAIIDLAFAGFGPTLHNCHLPDALGLYCQGSLAGLGTMPDGSVGVYGSSDHTLEDGRVPFNDTIDALIGALPSAARSFPNFIIPYRGGVVGTNPADSYIRGYEEFETYSFNLGTTYVEGSTNFTPRLLGADQVIWLVEFGARWVPGLPDLDVLQLEAPGIEYHASAGADGSGADLSRRACGNNPACSFGPDGLRFNPHQQDSDLFPTEVSGGYSAVILTRWESLFPSISLQLQTIFKHDVFGRSPGFASNFIKDRIIFDNGLEIRYKSNFSVNLGYQMFAGGGVANLLRDRDNARVFLKYQF